MDQAVADGLGVALNESSWLTFDLDVDAATVDLAFAVLTLPAFGAGPDDRRRTLRLSGVSRVVASYRDARWDDPDAAAIDMTTAGITALVQQLGCLPIYGWEFIDVGDHQFRAWRKRLSFDVSTAGAGDHTIDVFQEDGRRILDLRCWFDRLEVLDSNDQPMAIDEFIQGGRRWWAAMYAGDPRTSGEGIVPGAP